MKFPLDAENNLNVELVLWYLNQNEFANFEGDISDNNQSSYNSMVWGTGNNISKPSWQDILDYQWNAGSSFYDAYNGLVSPRWLNDVYVALLAQITALEARVSALENA